MDINKIHIPTDTTSSVMYNHEFFLPGNRNVSFEQVEPVTNGELSSTKLTLWQVNRGCEVVKLSDRRIAIKKFVIDDWIVRFSCAGYVNDFKEKFSFNVSGLEYLDKNVICHTPGSDVPDGFGSTHCGSRGYECWLLPGRYTDGPTVRGAVIQGCARLNGWLPVDWSDKTQSGTMQRENARLGAMQCGMHPWDLWSSNATNVKDGRVVMVKQYGDYSALCFGLFGGCQTATYYRDDTNGAYRQYDISDHPVIIDLDIESGSDPVNIASRECWHVAVGDTTVYHKDKTFENCWKKYGYVEDSSFNDTTKYIIKKTSAVSYINPVEVPCITDLEKHICVLDENQVPTSYLAWNITVTNPEEFWEPVRQWYATHDIYPAMLRGMARLFSDSNIGGTLTLNLTNGGQMRWSDMYCRQAFSGLSVDKLVINVSDEIIFHSTQELFYGINAKEIVWNGNPCSCFDCSGTFAYSNLKTYPNNLINWGNRNTYYWFGCTDIQYFLDLSRTIETVPSYLGEENRFNVDNNEIMVRISAQMLNCGSVKYFGPVLNVALVNKEESKYLMFNAPNLTDVRIKNLNHNDWYLDGTGVDKQNHGNLKSLNQESVVYLFENLSDLTKYNPDNIASAKTTFDAWNKNGYDLYEDSFGDKSYASNVMRINVRYWFDHQNEDTMYTSEVFTDMQIEIKNMESGDKITCLDYVFTENGKYTISNPDGKKTTFHFSTTATENRRNLIEIVIATPYDLRMPMNDHAELHCPEEWRDKVTDDMITAANAKNWTIYIGGTLKTV